MKKAILCVFLIILMIGSATSANISNNKDLMNTIKNEIVVIYNFEEPSLRTVQIGDVFFTRIFVTDLDPAGKPGEPLVPSKGAYILLPPDAEIVDIKVDLLGRNNKKTTYLVEPMEIPKTMVEVSSELPLLNSDIYSLNEFYPGKLFSQSGIYQFRGYTILVLLLHPIQYNPITGEIEYYQEFTVSIDTIFTDETPSLYRGLQEDQEQLRRKIDNPEDILLYSNLKTQEMVNDGNYDLLIITKDTYKDYFQPLKEYHDDRGVLTEIKTISDVGGTGSPEDIRNFIRNEYTSHNIEYVLLGGDANIVPAKMIYVSGMDEEKWFVSTTMPVDLYYACLDGNGPTNQGGDLIAEVYVGRACIGNSGEIYRFIDKTITYLNMRRGEDTYLDKIFLVGEYAGDHGIASFAGNYLDQLIDICDEDGYSTVGFPSNDYSILKLYDRDWPGFNKNNPYETGWQPMDVINIINNGTHIVPHFGHSWYNGYMKMHYDWIRYGYYKNEDTPFFAYSSGCMAGGFDDPEGYDCVAEWFTVKSFSGAFAGIWNARYGFFWSHRTDGDSHRYVREFFDAVYSEKIYNIAKANHDSKEDNLHLIDRSCMRWVYFQTNLFGDPTVSFHISYPPEKPETPTGPNKGKAGKEQTFSTSSIDPDGDQLYYKWNWGEGNYSDWLGPYESGETCEASYIWLEKDTYNITVKAKDVHGEQSLWSDPLAVSMPKSYGYNPIIQLLLKMSERFPFLSLLFSFL